MNSTRIAEEINRSKEKSAEIDGPINIYDLAKIGITLGVQSHEVYVSPCGGEKLRISIPGAQIRNVPMGTKAT